MFIAPAGHPVYWNRYIRNLGSIGASCNPETGAMRKHFLKFESIVQTAGDIRKFKRSDDDNDS
jgi:hypothetical protein